MSSELPQRPGISVLGASLDVGNRGVLALGASLADLCAVAKPGSRIFFHYGNSSGGPRRIDGETPVDVMVRNCRLSPSSPLSEHIGFILLLAILYRLGVRGPAMRNPWLRSLVEAEFIGDIRGGDSFSDIYGAWRFIEGSFPLLTVVLLGRPFTLLPQTYGPFRRRLPRWLAARLLRRATAVWTRDRNCADLVRGLSGRSVQFCPDVAFTLQAKRPSQVEIAPDSSIFDRRGLLVGVNVSGLLYMGGYTGRNMFGLVSDYRETIDRVVDKLLVTTEARVLLVPHTFGSEREEEACLTISKFAALRHAGRVFVLTTPLSERELKWLIGQTDFFIGSRMHACIAAISQCIPAVGLGYSDKFLGVFETAGVGESVIDLRRADSSQVVDEVLAAFEQRSATVVRLQGLMPSIGRQVTSAFRDVLATLPAAADQPG